MITVNEKIKNLRKDIDKIDQEILMNLKQRIEITKEIGRIKKTDQSDILDKKREIEIVDNLLTTGRKYQMDDDFVITIWRQIIAYSYKVQEESE
jgi:monofunctional chorismate mutase